MHPKLLELTVQRCREHMAAGDCHGEAPPTERLIDAVVQLSTALTGAQPAPAAPSEPMPSIPNDPECTCGSTSPRANHHAGSCPHSTPWNDRVRARLAAAPAAQPADSAMEVLTELVAVDDLQRSRAQAERHASKFPSDENYVVVDKLWSEIARRIKPAWDRARALVAKETPHAR